jgi:predicted HAD superfamily Cof-like phosphohydrolase
MTQKTETELYQLFEDGRYTPEETIQIVDQIKSIIDCNSTIVEVRQFMEVFEQTVNNEPTFPDAKTLELRLSLELEELIEFAEACGIEIYGYLQRLLFKKSQDIHYDMENKREHIKPNLVKALDAKLDQRYVNDGTIISLGMSKIFDEAFEEVHESNMSKCCLNEQEVSDTIKKYLVEGIPVISKENSTERLFLILRKSDNKVLKSINYKPAQLSKFIYLPVTEENVINNQE